MTLENDRDASMLPPHATQASHIRYEAARALVAAAPPSFGQEAILSGSTARGVADEDSDIEVVFYVDVFPARSELEAWLQRIQATDIVFETEPGRDGQTWLHFVFREIWIEVGWQRLDTHEKQLDAIISGAITAHGPLTLAWLIQHAISLRSVGLLARWRQKLVQYPETLSQRILAEATQYWFFPHFLAVRWALIRRGESLALLERLYQDTRNMLRVLFAINHQWEPDWKWLRRELEYLAIKPGNLLERIDTIFLEPHLEQRVACTLLLLRDVLELVPDQYDVTRVRENVQQSLREHGVGQK